MNCFSQSTTGKQFHLAPGITINHLLDSPPALSQIIYISLTLPSYVSLDLDSFGLLMRPPLTVMLRCSAMNPAVPVLTAFFWFLCLCILLLSLRSSPTLLLTLWASSLNSSSGYPETAISQTWFSAHNTQSDAHMNSSTACSGMIASLQIERAWFQGAAAWNVWESCKITLNLELNYVLMYLHLKSIGKMQLNLLNLHVIQNLCSAKLPMKIT